VFLTTCPGCNLLNPFLLHRTKIILGAEPSHVKDFLVRRNTGLWRGGEGNKTLK